MRDPGSHDLNALLRSAAPVQGDPADEERVFADVWSWVQTSISDGATLDNMLDGVQAACPVATVTIQGQEARLALVDDDPENPGFWYVVGQSDGPLFLLLAPETLTQDQVLEIAEQVAYTR
jgi:hypothetical protein